MAGKSFYDLDYMIEINERRLEQYAAGRDKVFERLTNIFVIYSAIAIFLVPIVRMILYSGPKPWWLNVCFVLFAVLFAVSIYYSIRLMMPANTALLNEPKIIYNNCRMAYEAVLNDTMSIENLLKGSYIEELEKCVNANLAVYNRIATWYYKALIFVLLSAAPYLVCLGSHISNQEIENEQKWVKVKNEKL